MEEFYLEVISGKKKGVGPSLLKCLFLFLSFFYGVVVRFRNLLFNLGLKKSHAAKVPVISIGNITTGGTGKTPFSAWVCHWYLNRNRKPVFLSRGYKSLDEESNDEKRVLEQLCPGVPHLQNRDRVRSSQKAVEEFGAEVLLLDDGFQHRRLRRDLEIVLIDAMNPWGYGHLLPRGLLREPLSGLKRADLIVITRADHVDESVIEKIVERIASIRGTPDHVRVAYPPSRLISHEESSQDIGDYQGKKVAAFCGIGNPEGFRKMLKSIDLEPVWFKAFPDHHHFTGEDFQQMETELKEKKIEVLLTTQKDLVKFPKGSISSFPLYAVQIETKVLFGEELLEKALSMF